MPKKRTGHRAALHAWHHRTRAQIAEDLAEIEECRRRLATDPPPNVERYLRRRIDELTHGPQAHDERNQPSD